MVTKTKIDITEVLYNDKTTEKGILLEKDDKIICLGCNEEQKDFCFFCSACSRVSCKKCLKDSKICGCESFYNETDYLLIKIMRE